MKISLRNRHILLYIIWLILGVVLLTYEIAKEKKQIKYIASTFKRIELEDYINGRIDSLFYFSSKKHHSLIKLNNGNKYHLIVYNNYLYKDNFDLESIITKNDSIYKKANSHLIHVFHNGKEYVFSIEKVLNKNYAKPKPLFKCN